MRTAPRNSLLVLAILMCCIGSALAQRKIKIKVTIEENVQVLKLKVRCKRGDLVNFSESFTWAYNSFDTTDIRRIAQHQTYLPELYASALYLINDSAAYLYEYDENSGGIDSVNYARLLDLTQGYSLHGFMSGNHKRVYQYTIPIWVNPNILATRPKDAAFYLRVVFDQGAIPKQEILFDECEIIYRI